MEHFVESLKSLPYVFAVYVILCIAVAIAVIAGTIGVFRTIPDIRRWWRSRDKWSLPNWFEASTGMLLPEWTKHLGVAFGVDVFWLDVEKAEKAEKAEEKVHQCPWDAFVAIQRAVTDEPGSALVKPSSRVAQIPNVWLVEIVGRGEDNKKWQALYLGWKTLRPGRWQLFASEMLPYDELIDAHGVVIRVPRKAQGKVQSSDRVCLLELAARYSCVAEMAWDMTRALAAGILAESKTDQRSPRLKALREQLKELTVEQCAHSYPDGLRGLWEARLPRKQEASAGGQSAEAAAAPSSD